MLRKRGLGSAYWIVLLVIGGLVLMGIVWGIIGRLDGGDLEDVVLGIVEGESVSGVIALNSDGSYVFRTSDGEEYAISGGEGLVPGTEVSVPVSEISEEGEINAESVVVVGDGKVESVLTPAELVEVEFVKEDLRAGDTHHPDYSGLYDLLETKKNDIGKIRQICDDFDSIFCLKGASARSPDLRGEICDDLEVKLIERYKDKYNQDKLNRFIEGHRLDCSLGIPQFMY